MNLQKNLIKTCGIALRNSPNEWTGSRFQNSLYLFWLDWFRGLCLLVHLRRYFSRLRIVLRIKKTFGIESRIKWPNDIYVGDGKVAGILIENDLMGACISRSIAGIGLNVNQTAFDPALPNPTSLALQKGAEFDRSEVFERFYGFLTVRCRQLDGGDYGKLDEDYIARLYRFGERHPFVDGLTGERFRGTIWDVLYGGELRVEKETGEICDYLFKEIEYVHDRDGEVSAK